MSPVVVEPVETHATSTRCWRSTAAFTGASTERSEAPTVIFGFDPDPIRWFLEQSVTPPFV
jgi:hypothetical protein